MHGRWIVNRVALLLTNVVAALERPPTNASARRRLGVPARPLRRLVAANTVDRHFELAPRMR